MERIAQTPPSPSCFGLAYRPDKVCGACPKQVECAQLVKNHVPLSDLSFNFTPPSLNPSAAAKAAEVNGQIVDDAYMRAHYRIFGAWPKQLVGRHWKLVYENVKIANMSTETFIAVMLLAWKMTCPKTLFPINKLTAPLTPDKVKLYADACRKAKGFVDTDSMAAFLDQNTSQSVDDLIRRGEILFGTNIVTWKIFRGGPIDYRSLYESEIEQSADPYWLAIEPTYAKYVLSAHLADPTKGTYLQREIRSDVAQHLGLLKRRSTIASTVMAARSRIMSTAVKAVLYKRQLETDDFTHENKVVTDSANFWNKLGLAVLHLECIRAVDSLPHRLWR